MELEPDGPGLDVSNSGQEKPGQQIAVGEPGFELVDGHLERAFARGVFDQPHDWLDFGAKTNHLRTDPGFIGSKRSNGFEAGPWGKLGAQTKGRGHLKKPTSLESPIHCWFSSCVLAVWGCVAACAPILAREDERPAALIMECRGKV